MKLSSRAYDLYHAFEQPGCAVCRLTAASVHHYLSSLMYEYTNEPPTHMALRAARGFCPTHAWHIEDELNATALGVAVLYEGVLRTMLKEMGPVSPDSGRLQLNRVANALKPQEPCPACEHRDIVESHLLRNLLEHLTQEEFATGLRQSAGLCLTHLRMALDLNGYTASKALLVAIQQNIWQQLQRELVEYKRKSDYNLLHEGMGAEGDSSRRVIEQLSGVKGLR